MSTRLVGRARPGRGAHSAHPSILIGPILAPHGAHGAHRTGVDTHRAPLAELAEMQTQQRLAARAVAPLLAGALAFRSGALANHNRRDMSQAPAPWSPWLPHVSSGEYACLVPTACYA